MKRFLALLLLVAAPAFAQELPPTYDPTVEQTYTIQQSTTTTLQNIDQTGGTALTLYDDGTTFEPILLPFEFYYFGSLFDTVYISQNGFISFTSNANGCCSGNELPFLSQDPYYNLNNSIFAMWSDLADFNTPGNPYYKSTGNSFVVGWYDVEELSSAPTTCNEFGCTQSGPGNKFTFEISLFADSSFSVSYGSFDYNNQTGRLFTSGYQGDTATEYNQFYWGNDPTVLQNTTYFVQSSEIVPLPPDTPIAPDCTLNPTDPTCIINDLTDFTDEEPVLVADENTGSSDGTEVVQEEDPAPAEEMLADAEMIEEELVDEETTDEESLEEMLAEESDEEEVVTEERLVVYRELSDEEKAAILADAISKNTLEAALSIATDAASSATSTTSVSDASLSVSLSTKKDVSSGSSSELVAENNSSQNITVAENTQDTGSASMESAAEILETGRLIGQEALTVTMAATEASANESVSEAQTVATISSAESQVTVASNNETILDNTIETNSDNNNQSSDQTTLTENEVLVAEQTITEQEVTSEIQNTDALNEQTVAVVETEQTTDTNNTTQETPSAVEFTSIEEVMETFASNVNLQAAAEQEELENTIVQQAIASSQTNDEDNKMGFAEAEAVTIASDPALANAFNVQPNTASLELLGVLSNKPEEKSDAELRAEQVVAANKEQQDAINANYMEADQSGILAAIGSETDVTSYRTAMLRDNNNWYKPEDIYKGVIIKDNVRGSYFLEKGNTDTYKKMIEEQYK
jgi:hypothetical protein